MDSISHIVLDDETLEVEDTKARTEIGDVSSLQTTTKESLVDAVNECFQSASDGKALVASAITGMGVATSKDATFATMAGNISSIKTGVDTSDATATDAQILSGATAYVKGSKVTGKIPVQVTSESNSPTSAYFHCHGDSYAEPAGNNTFMMPPAGYYDGITWVGYNEPNLKASNLKAGVSIGNNQAKMTGTFTSDATAGAAQLLSGVTAYVNGTKITGTMANNGTTPYAGANGAASDAFNDTTMAQDGNNNQNEYVGAFDLKFKAGYINGSVSRLHIPNLIQANIKKGVKVGWSNSYIEGTATGFEGSINGLIKSYRVLSGETITAGNFVQWVNEYVQGSGTTLNAGASTQLSSYIAGAYNGIAAVLLNDTAAAVVHTDSTSTGGGYLLVTICTVQSGAISIVKTFTKTEIGYYSMSSYAAGSMNVLKVTEKTIFITYPANTSTAYALDLMTITFSSDWQTISVQMNRRDSSYSISNVKATWVNGTTIVVHHKYSTSDSGPYHILTAVNFNSSYYPTIAGQSSVLSSAYAATWLVSPKENVILFSYRALYDEINSNLAYKVVKWNGSSFELIGGSYFYSDSRGFTNNLCMLTATKGLLVYEGMGNAGTMAVVVTFSDTYISATVGTSVEIHVSIYADSFELYKLSETSVIVSHNGGTNAQYDSSKALYLHLLTISGTTLTVTSSVLASSVSNSGSYNRMIFSNGYIYNAHGLSYYPAITPVATGGTVYECVRNLTTANKYVTTTGDIAVRGVALQSGTGGSTIQVCVPNV